MKINRQTPKFAASFAIKQFPWKLSKMIRLKRRKWLKIKFSTRFSSLKKKSGVINFRFFRTYKNKIKKLFKFYFAPKLTDRQCQKLFKLNSRYKATFQKIFKVESRLDTLVFRLYMLSDIALARELIKKNYFLLNNKIITAPTIILKVGDILATSNTFAWHFLYQNMLKVISSLLKYFSRLFLKFSFPFIIKRKNFHLKEYGKFKERAKQHLGGTLLNRITTRSFFLRYKKVKETTTSKIKPAKKYYFKKAKANESFKNKRLKAYILKKYKTKTNFGLPLFCIPQASPSTFRKRHRGFKKMAYQKPNLVYGLKFNKLPRIFRFKKSPLRSKFKKLCQQTTFLKSFDLMVAKRLDFLEKLRVALQRVKKRGRKLPYWVQKKQAKTKKANLQALFRKDIATVKKPIIKQLLNVSQNRKQNRRFQRSLKKRKKKFVVSVRNLPKINSSYLNLRSLLAESRFREISKSVFPGRGKQTSRNVDSARPEQRNLYSVTDEKNTKASPRNSVILSFLQKRPRFNNKFKKLFIPERIKRKFVFSKKRRLTSSSRVINYIYSQRRVSHRFSKAKKKRGSQLNETLKLYRKTIHFKKLFRKSTVAANQGGFFSYKLVKSRRSKKPKWRRWVPKTPKNFWQTNRITKKNLYLFRYLKKFNYKYKQYSFYQKLKQNSWSLLMTKESLPTGRCSRLASRGQRNLSFMTNAGRVGSTDRVRHWQKINLIFEKKKRKLLIAPLSGKGVVFVKNKIKSVFVYKNYISRVKPKTLVTTPSPLRAKVTRRIIPQKFILRIKRKYLRLKGFFRQYQDLKIKIALAEKNQIYAPVQIRYKKINLLFKNRPIAYYFVEANYKDLEFTIVSDVDLLFFPYKFYCNQ